MQVQSQATLYLTLPQLYIYRHWIPSTFCSYPSGELTVSRSYCLHYYQVRGVWFRILDLLVLVHLPLPTDKEGIIAVTIHISSETTSWAYPIDGFSLLSKPRISLVVG